MYALDVRNLRVCFGAFKAVDEVSFVLRKGEILGIVGESGCGKSLCSLALMGLVDYPGKVYFDSLVLNGREVSSLTSRERSKLLGVEISIIFQDALSSLDPSYTIGFQLVETLKVHGKGSSRRELREKAVDLLAVVGISDPTNRFFCFPHELSGGMAQRVVIALAIAGDPKILIADEPTTALDVTIQAQIMDLLLSLQEDRGMSLILISHDLALVAENASRILVMYAGKIIEEGLSNFIFVNPAHPYTQALIDSLPEFNEAGSRLKVLDGVVPGKDDRPKGCLLSNRCPYSVEKCKVNIPLARRDESGMVLCHFPLRR